MCPFLLNIENQYFVYDSFITRVFYKEKVSHAIRMEIRDKLFLKIVIMEWRSL